MTRSLGPYEAHITIRELEMRRRLQQRSTHRRRVAPARARLAALLRGMARRIDPSAGVPQHPTENAFNKEKTHGQA